LKVERSALRGIVGGGQLRRQVEAAELVEDLAAAAELVEDLAAAAELKKPAAGAHTSEPATSSP
jgi:hypothetical protein